MGSALKLRPWERRRLCLDERLTATDTAQGLTRHARQSIDGSVRSGRGGDQGPRWSHPGREPWTVLTVPVALVQRLVMAPLAQHLEFGNPGPSGH